MISQKNRFHGFNSLRHVYRQGLTVRGPLFAVKYLANPRRKSYRLAVVVSRKVNKSAVARNRIRRRLYEAARLLAPGMSQPYDIVITVFSDSISATDHQELLAQLKRQLHEAGIL